MPERNSRKRKACGTSDASGTRRTEMKRIGGPQTTRESETIQTPPPIGRTLPGTEHLTKSDLGLEELIDLRNSMPDRLIAKPYPLTLQGVHSLPDNTGDDPLLYSLSRPVSALADHARVISPFESEKQSRPALSLRYALKQISDMDVISVAPRPPMRSTQELPFVNRTPALLQLLALHNEIFTRSGNGNAGLAKVVPILDSPFGMGKTYFGLNYVKALRERFGIESGLDLIPEIPHLIREALTVAIIFAKGELAGCGDDFTQYNKIVMSKLKYALGLRNEYEFLSVEALLREVALELGRPIFVVFDEAPQGCVWDSSSEDQHRKIFFNFISYIVEPLLSLPSVFVLVSGRARFMMNVGLRTGTNDYPSQSPVRFARIHLTPIIPEYIREILEKAKLGTQTYWEVFDADLRTRGEVLQLDRIALELYQKTSGHPRSLVAVLDDMLRRQGEGGYEILLNSWPRREMMQVIHENPEAVQTLLACHRRTCAELNEVQFSDAGPDATSVVLRGFTEEKGAMDLSMKIQPNLPKSSTYQDIANHLLADYGQDIKQTFILIPPLSLHLIEISLFSLVDYVRFLSEARHFDVNYGLIFEKCLMKFFQDRFQNDSNTFKEVMGRFCPEDSFLGDISLSLKGVSNSTMPRVLSEMNSRSKTTINSDDCADLVGDYIDAAPLVVAPMDKSHSPDLSLFPVASGSEKVLIGVAAKNLGMKTKMKLTDIRGEVIKFLKIIHKKNIENLKVSLLVCATQYTRNIAPTDGRRALVFPCNELKEGISFEFEVVLMRLDSIDLRREFFSMISGNKKFLDTIEAVIAKDAVHAGSSSIL